MTPPQQPPQARDLTRLLAVARETGNWGLLRLLVELLDQARAKRKARR